MTNRALLLTLILAFLPALAAAGDAAVSLAGAAQSSGKDTVLVTLTTTLGVITLQLDTARAPVSVANFLAYVDAGHYDNTLFHRVIPGFMIQGGGYTPELKEKSTRDPIKNEAANGLTNDSGTIAMARTAEVDSATSQFFINLVNNRFLNNSQSGYGYAVFGKVVTGMDVVNAIAATPTASRGGLDNVPVAQIRIVTAKRVAH